MGPHRSKRRYLPCECRKNQRKRWSLLKSISRFRKIFSLTLHNQFLTCCVMMQSCFTPCVVHPLGNSKPNRYVTARSRKQHNTTCALVHVLNPQLRKRNPIGIVTNMLGLIAYAYEVISLQYIPYRIAMKRRLQCCLETSNYCGFELLVGAVLCAE